MKSTILILALMMTSTLLAGCSGDEVKLSETKQVDADLTSDLSEQPMNPDIGELDDIPVSEGLPQ